MTPWYLKEMTPWYLKDMTPWYLKEMTPGYLIEIPRDISMKWPPEPWCHPAVWSQGCWGPHVWWTRCRQGWRWSAPPWCRRTPQPRTISIKCSLHLSHLPHRLNSLQVLVIRKLGQQVVSPVELVAVDHDLPQCVSPADLFGLLVLIPRVHPDIGPRDVLRDSLHSTTGSGHTLGHQGGLVLSFPHPGLPRPVLYFNIRGMKALSWA